MPFWPCIVLPFDSIAVGLQWHQRCVARPRGAFKVSLVTFLCKPWLSFCLFETPCLAADSLMRGHITTMQTMQGCNDAGVWQSLWPNSKQCCISVYDCKMHLNECKMSSPSATNSRFNIRYTVQPQRQLRVVTKRKDGECRWCLQCPQKAPQGYLSPLPNAKRWKFSRTGRLYIYAGLQVRQQMPFSQTCWKMKPTSWRRVKRAFFVRRALAALLEKLHNWSEEGGSNSSRPGKTLHKSSLTEACCLNSLKDCHKH